MDRSEYCAQVLAGLRHLSRREREAVRAELEDHMEDHARALLDLGYDERLAEERTVAAMGDPAEVAREMERQYPRGWSVVVGVSVMLSTVIIVSALFGIGMLEPLWNSIVCRFLPPEDFGPSAVSRPLDIRIPIGNDILRIYRVALTEWEGEPHARVSMCAYDRLPGGVVSRQLISHVALESQRGPVSQRTQLATRGGSSWFCDAALLYVPVQSGDGHVTLRYERFGESLTVDIPLPEEVET